MLKSFIKFLPKKEKKVAFNFGRRKHRVFILGLAGLEAETEPTGHTREMLRVGKMAQSAWAKGWIPEERKEIRITYFTVHAGSSDAQSQRCEEAETMFPEISDSLSVIESITERGQLNDFSWLSKVNFARDKNLISNHYDNDPSQTLILRKAWWDNKVSYCERSSSCNLFTVWGI